MPSDPDPKQETHRARIAMEKDIATKVVDCLLANSEFSLSINNGGDEDEIAPTRDRGSILAAMFATDEENVCVHRAVPPDGKLRRAGSVYLVYGNDGWDVIADYHTSLEQFIEPASALATNYCNELQQKEFAQVPIAPARRGSTPPVRP